MQLKSKGYNSAAKRSIWLIIELIRDFALINIISTMCADWLRAVWVRVKNNFGVIFSIEVLYPLRYTDFFLDVIESVRDIELC